MRALYSRIDQLAMQISCSNNAVPPGGMCGTQMRPVDSSQVAMGQHMGQQMVGPPIGQQVPAQPAMAPPHVPQLAPPFPQQPMTPQPMAVQQMAPPQMAPPQMQPQPMAPQQMVCAPGQMVGSMPKSMQIATADFGSGHTPQPTPMQAALAAVQQTQPAAATICVPPSPALPAPAIPLPVLGFATADGGCGPRQGPQGSAASTAMHAVRPAPPPQQLQQMAPQAPQAPQQYMQFSGSQQLGGLSSQQLGGLTIYH